MRQSKNAVLTAAIVLGMISGISVGSAQAYFTTYATARGGHTLHIGNQSQIKEEFSRWTKHISLENTGNTESYVRVKVFAGSVYGLEYSGSGQWRAGEDGYWYYDEILPAGGVTDVLDVRIELPAVTDETGNSVPYS